MTAIAHSFNRFPLIACLVGAAVLLGAADIFIWHGVGAATYHGIAASVEGWRDLAIHHTETVTWIVGLPTLAVGCYTVKRPTPRSVLAIIALAAFTLLTVCLGASPSVADGLLTFGGGAFVLIIAFIMVYGAASGIV